MEFWRKRVRRNVLRRGGELSQLSTVAIAGTLCCLLLGACADSMQPADGPRLKIHLDDEYVVRDPESHDGIVRFQIRNVGIAIAHFRGCPGPIPFVVERDDGGWEDFLQVNTICQAIYTSSELALPPGGDTAYSYVSDHPGRYRLRILFGDTAADPWDYWVRTGAFEIQ